MTRAVAAWVDGELAREQPASALHHLRQMTIRMVRRTAAIDRIETAVRCGDRATARAELADVESFTAATGAAWAAAAAAHGRALLAADVDAEPQFAQALAHQA